MKYRLIGIGLLLTFVVIFMVQNAVTVEINILFWQLTFPRSILVLLMLLIGVVIGWVTRAIYRISRTVG